MAHSIHDSHRELTIAQGMEVRREEYLDYITFAANERPLFREFLGPMVGVKAEWAAHGASPAELDLSAFRFRRPMHGYLPVATGWMDGQPEEILEETDAYIIATDYMGRRVKLCKGMASIPLPLDYPVKTMDDWQRLKPHYALTERRLTGEWERAAHEHREAGRVVTVWMPGGFDTPRELMGEAALCLAFYDDPELVHDIIDTLTHTVFSVLERVSAVAPIDELSVHEDLAGKSGPLPGPRQVEEFIAPYYRRVWDLLRDRGARVFSQDSDGNIEAVIPAFLDAGVNLMYPMEPAAGMDIVSLRTQYGTRLAFGGGIDKHVLRGSLDEITAELEYKIPPMVHTGGCLLSLDHRIPNGTPLAHYRFYIDKAWEIMERETARIV